MEQTQTKAEKLAEDGSRETKSQGNADAAVAVENQLAEMELNATANERAGKEETVYSDLSFGMMANSGYPKVYQFTKDIPTESIFVGNTNYLCILETWIQYLLWKNFPLQNHTYSYDAIVRIRKTFQTSKTHNIFD